jgi:hypothetical protein
LRIKLIADERASFTVMFEPTGMTYELGPSEHMYAEVQSVELDEMQIVYWEGGVSVWPPGPILTLDSAGERLHELNY